MDSLQVELGALSVPCSREKAAATAILLVHVAKDKEPPPRSSRRRLAEEEAVAKRAGGRKTEAIAADAQADLDEAMPALEAAVESLNALNKARHRRR